MNRPQQFRAKLSDKTELNPRFVQYVFELVDEPNRLEFAAGQYISLALPEDGLRRSYSLCSSPENDHGFEVLVDRHPNGKGVNYFESLKFGDAIAFLAPMGVFTIADPTSPLVFVATASGIAPFRSMIYDQLQIQKSTREIVLHWGMRHAEELFWEDEWEELAEDFPNFHFHPVISQPVTEWPFCQGRVTNCLATHELLRNANYYICGSDTMIADVMQLLQERGVTRDHLHREIFFTT